jgi:hypothetical protein
LQIRYINLRELKSDRRFSVLLKLTNRIKEMGLEACDREPWQKQLTHRLVREQRLM